MTYELRLERRQRELRRITLPRTSVNKKNLREDSSLIYYLCYNGARQGQHGSRCYSDKPGYVRNAKEFGIVYGGRKDVSGASGRSSKSSWLMSIFRPPTEMSDASKLYFLADGGCSVCGLRHLHRGYKPNFQMLRSDGTEVTEVTSALIAQLRSGVMMATMKKKGVRLIRCKNCGHTWPLLDDQPTVRVDEIIETPHRTQTNMGTDTRQLTNASAATAERGIDLKQTWSQSWNVEYEKATRTNIATNIAAKGAIGLRSEVEEQIRKKYVATETLSREYTDTLTLTLPPQTKVLTTIEWKKIWQHGVVKLSDGGQVPFKVAVQLTYDYSTQDVV